MGAKGTVGLWSLGAKEVGLYYCTAEESCGRTLSTWVGRAGRRPGLELGAKQLLGLFIVCQGTSRAQRSEELCCQCVCVEIINNVKVAFSPPTSAGGTLHYKSQISASMATKWEQKDTGNNRSRSHLSASVTPVFLLVLDDVCVTSSVCFWFLGAGFLCLCGIALLQLNSHVASSAPCSVLTFHCKGYVMSKEPFHAASCFTFPLPSTAGGTRAICMH